MPKCKRCEEEVDSVNEDGECEECVFYLDTDAEYRTHLFDETIIPQEENDG